jgi:carbonic anhydrase
VVPEHVRGQRHAPPGVREAKPAGPLAVLTCMDPRVEARAFGPAFRRAFVLRNAGGRATHDVVRSLVIAWRVLDVTEFVVVHHTDCRMMAVTDDQLRADLSRVVTADVTEMEFLTFSDLRASVVQDVDRLRRSRYLADGLPVSGFIWNLAGRELQAVVIDPRGRFAGARRRSAGPGQGPERGARPPGGTIALPSGGIWRLRRP